MSDAPPLPATIYLAGPAVFLPDAPRILRAMARIVAAAGLEPVLPAIDLDCADLPAQQAAKAIRAENCRRILACRGMVACVSPFRGDGPDPGTVWEIGFGQAAGKEIALWSEKGGPDLLGRPVARGIDQAAQLIAQRLLQDIRARA